MIERDEFSLFPDAITVLLSARRHGTKQAAASASKNARPMLQRVSRSRVLEEVGGNIGAMDDYDTLYSVFDVDACGLDVRDKVEILRIAADRLSKLPGRPVERYVVVEDAPSGIEAAKSLGFQAVGVWRIGREEALRLAGADAIVRDLREAELGQLV